MDYKKTITYIKTITPQIPEIGIILGSGLGSLAENIKNPIKIPYKDIPGFIPPTIEGHSGNLIFGYLNNRSVVVMQGRNHYYEGHSMKEITYPIRIMKLLGAHTLITSNATGGLNEKLKIGDIVLVKDHINLMGDNPLIGKNDTQMGPRFLDMTQIYNIELIKLIRNSFPNTKTGILTSVSGPTYETPAEYIYLKNIGADVVGMSTIPEVIVGHHMGMKIFSMSLVTNVLDPNNVVKVSHSEVQKIANESSKTMSKIVLKLLNNI